jgi:hypothetical protein
VSDFNRFVKNVREKPDLKFWGPKNFGSLYMLGFMCAKAFYLASGGLLGAFPYINVEMLRKWLREAVRGFIFDGAF